MNKLIDFLISETGAFLAGIVFWVVVVLYIVTTYKLV